MRQQFTSIAEYSAEHEEGELHRRVLGVIPGHELRLRFRQIERRAVVLRVHGHEEDEAADQLREEIPDVHLLVADDLHEIERAADHQHADDREAERHLVRDHLRRASAGAPISEYLLFEAQPPRMMPYTLGRRERQDQQQPDVDARRRERRRRTVRNQAEDDEAPG